jgi:Na+-transporting methylmalonyl-CoA/oxaloacetate decarboxylase gamma subunit
MSLITGLIILVLVGLVMYFLILPMYFPHLIGRQTPEERREERQVKDKKKFEE